MANETIRLVRKNSTAVRISMGEIPSIDLSSVDEIDVPQRVAADLADGDQFTVKDAGGTPFNTVAELLAAHIDA